MRSFDGVNPQRDPIDTESGYNEKSLDDEKSVAPQYQDAFGNEENAEVKYKTMEWWYVSQANADDIRARLMDHF